MKQYIYPAVLTQDNETKLYIAAFYDLEIFVEAESVEEVFVSAKSYLENYLVCCLRFNADFSEPSSYEETRKRYPNDQLLMIEANLKNIKSKDF